MHPEQKRKVTLFAALLGMFFALLVVTKQEYQFFYSPFPEWIDTAAVRLGISALLAAGVTAMLYHFRRPK
jgi:hypothetical protein